MGRHSSGWQPPQEFEEYRLVQLLGHGAMGQVYLAHDTLLDRFVAIKFIAALDVDPVARERFLVEARAAARLQHPNVVAVYRIGELDRHPYLVSEFIRGQSLDHLAKPVPYQQALKLAIDLARGLAAAHRRGVLHRDIKPANAILAENGDAKLVDFGLAKLAVLEETLDSTPGLAATVAAPSAVAAAAAAGGQTGAARTVALGPHHADTVAAAPHADAAPVDPGLAATAVRPGVAALAAAHESLAATASLPVAGSRRSGAGSSGPGAPSPSLTRAGDIIGTPLYMPPEVWRSEPSTPRSDVYSLGALVFELAAGRPPDRGNTLFELGRRVLDQPAPSLGTLAVGMDPRFVAIVDRCLARDPAARLASGDEVRDALEQLAEADRGVPRPAGNPYRGLLAFEAEHRGVFFGRGHDVRAVLERLRAEPFLLVGGDSGVGKSSLCRAGVVPAVTDGALGEGRTWTTVTVVPGRHPRAAFAAALAPRLGRDEGALLADLVADPAGVGRELRRRQGEREGTLVFVDQIEELCTLADPEEARVAGELLGALALRAPGVRLLAAGRGDFLTRLAVVPGLGPEVVRALHLLAPLGPEATREAIVGPARVTGVSFESRELLDELVASSSRAAAGLPLLQFALAELWEARDQARNVITARSLESLGGVAGALARHADAVLQGLGPEPRRAARRLLTALVTAEGTRARRTAAELNATDPAAAAALETLVRGRLLCVRESDEGAVYEVAHEALLTGWSSLRGWLDAEAGTRAVRRRVEAAAAEWERLGREPEALWIGRQLEEAAALDRASLAPREQGFLAAAAAAARRRRRRRVAQIAAVPLALCLIGAGFVVASRLDLRRRVARQVAAATTALTEARAGSAEVESLQQQAFRHFDSRARDPGEAAWTRAGARALAVERAFGRASQELETALNLDPRRRDVRALFAQVLYERALVAERDRRSQQRDELLERLALYDDGGVLARRWRQPAEIRVVSTPPGARAVLEPQHVDDQQRRVAGERADLGATPVAARAVAPGSYLVRLELAGHVPVIYPVLVRRGERREVQVLIPRAEEVPRGFVFVPGGPFLFGCPADDGVRRGFYTTAPQHEVQGASFAIARHETTFGDWIEFLRALPADERARRLPKVSSIGFRGSLHLQPVGADGWRLTFQPATRSHAATTGAKVTYPTRPRRAAQDWLRFPVSGVAFDDAQAYAAWLARSGRVPGARVCSEIEWEHAARGADGRDFPHGDRLATDDANIDETYGKVPDAFGPDEVGAHPASRSPFGVDDMVGNVWEWTTGALHPKEPVVLRGGSYYHDQASARSFNRSTPEPTMRDPALGVRICASLPGR